ncbi:MAG: tetratricopeptide repeat protein [Bacteroidetes bacterium]|nr:tetratricopeptide repeat protein [Bacteroidota bacterium]
MNTNFLYALLFLLAASPIYSQQKKIDSLQIVAQNAANDSLLVDALHKISVIYSNTEPDSGLHYARKCYNLSLKNGFKPQLTTAYSQIAYSHNTMGNLDSAVYYWVKSADEYGEQGNGYRQSLVLNNAGGQLALAGEYDKAVPLLEKAKVVAETGNYLDMLSDTYINYGLIDDLKGNYDKAFALYQKALIYADSSGSKSQRMTVLNNIGLMFYYMGDFEKAIPYFYDVVHYWKYKADIFKPSSISLAYMNLGVCFDELSQNDSALHYHNLALNIDLELKNKYNQGRHYHNIGVIYEKENKAKEALKYLHLSEKLKEETKNIESLGNTYHHLAEIYLKSGNTDLSKNYLDKTQSAAFEIQSKEQLENNFKLFAKYYETVGDYKNALMYQQKYQIIKDTLYELEKVATIHDIEAKRQVQEKEKEAAILSQRLSDEKNDSSKKSDYLFLSLLALVLAVVTGFIFYNKNQQKSKKNKSLEQGIKRLEKLLKDLEHRTNGQFNTAAYFLSTRRRLSDKSSVSVALKDTENLFNSLVTINKNLSIDSKSSLKNSAQVIAENLKFGATNLSEKDLKIDISIPSLNTSSTNNLTLGTIINELITNSLKYAFDDEPSPKIKLMIEPKEDYSISFSYSDNGIGHKIHDITSGKGLEIIEDMIEQLNGTYEIQTKNGFQFNASFPKFIKDEG